MFAFVFALASTGPLLLLVDDPRINFLLSELTVYVGDITVIMYLALIHIQNFDK